MSRFSIRTLLILSILLPLSVVYAISMLIDIRNSRKDAIENVQIHLSEQISEHAAQVEIRFSAAAQIPKTLAAELSVMQVQSEEEVDALIREVLKKFPRPIGSCIAFEPNEFREGIERFAPYVHRKVLESAELFSVDLAKTYEKDYMTWDWYRIPKETGRPVWSEPYFDEGGGNTLMCTYSVPFFHNDRFAGVITIDVGLDDLHEIMARFARKGERYYLLSASGRYVVATDPELDLAMKETIFSIAEKYHKPELVEAGRKMLQGKEGILPYNRIKDNRRVWLAYAPLPITGWSLKVAMDESLVFEPVYASIYHTILHFLVEFSVILIVIVVVAGRLTAPIKRLATTAGRLAAGDLDAHVGDVRFAVEINQMALAFDKMVDDLKSSIEQRIREESARRAVESELKAARRIQASLLPRVFPPFPDRTEFDLHATNEPVAVVAGDFFDFFFIGPNTLVLILADVSGHGIPASLFMAVSRTVIRKLAVPERSPREIIDNVNQVLSRDNDDTMFVTLFYGHYDTKTGELTYVNAGHDPPYVVRPNGSLETLPATGPLVAAFEAVSYEEQTVRLDCGDVLVMFTDGVTEAHSSRNNILYGVERLERLLRELRSESVTEICGRICRAVDDFSEHERQDDTTLLVLRRNESPSQ